ncbi:MAG: hypothetical protein ACK4K7_09140 [Allosphingosinicella sp.]|uniref:hypothetical protein n=1 Tax=Allosphingosinicella sp. TaxID=2823234 RepID=UPI003949EBC6
MIRWLGAAWILIGLTACAPGLARLQQDHLSEDRIIDLMENPEKWDGATVRIKIYPYDNGFRKSYVVCFEPRDEAYAERSPFVIYTGLDRFAGLKGSTPVVVTARYDSGCFYRSTLCPDTRFGLFTEVITLPPD